MKEASVNAEIVKSIRANYPSAWAYKIPDTPGPHMAPKPFDIIWLHHRTTLDAKAIETKLYKKYSSVKLSDLRPNQQKGLRDFDALCDCESFVAAVYRFFTPQRRRVAELYLIPYRDLYESRVMIYDFIEYNYRKHELVKGVWNL